MKTNKRKARKTKESNRIYSLIVLAAFILGIVFIPIDPKERLRTLSGEEEVKYVEELERKRQEKRQMELAAKARKGKLKSYIGPGVLVVPPKKNEPLSIEVCRGLFNISTILEGYGNVLHKDIIHNALTINSKPVIEFFEKYRDPIIESILNDIGDLEDILIESESVLQGKDYDKIKMRLMKNIGEFLERGCEKMERDLNPFNVFVEYN